MCIRDSHMTQADLAGKVGVTDKAVSRWERGLGFPDINTMEPLAEALDVSPVSYTHLDVYKRQFCGRFEPGGSGFPGRIQ